MSQCFYHLQMSYYAVQDLISRTYKINHFLFFQLIFFRCTNTKSLECVDNLDHYFLFCLTRTYNCA